jgi:putative ABC transport system permease protein
VGILQRHPGSDLLPELGINHAALVMGRVELLGTAPDDLHLLVRLQAGTDSREVAQQLRGRVAALLPRQSVAATAAWDVLQMRQEQTTLYARFLAILGGVALAIGTLGIANIMLVSVTERTAEIGLRMAIGARRSDIVLQFMAEGVLICLLGSVVGLVGGSVVAGLTLSMAGIDLVLPLSVVIQAAGLALACGIAAAAFPAYRAAGLQPRQALAAG